jgi:hypothetical protein
MKRFVILGLIAAAALVAVALAPAVSVEAAPSDKACWGQASKVFAQAGEMGTHSSQQANPRLGLRNLARALFDQGVLAEPTMQALGAFVATDLGLSIDACQ